MTGFQIAVVSLSAGGLFTGSIVGVYIWVAKHVGCSDTHPKKKDIVFLNVCEERRKANEIEHDHLKEGINAAIARSDEQHVELKQDMRAGFSEIKELIKKNGGR